MIEVDGATKVFHSLDGADVLALRGVSLSIKRNEFVSVVGPSGCGKSTLLRLIAGLILPSSGTVKIDGMNVDAPRRDIGIVFQAPTLLPWSNVLANVLFPLKVLRRMDADSEARAYDLLKLVGLGDFAKKMPSELSGGMQQRAAICRALIHDPGILLMDEPFGALDALTREEMSMELLRIWSERPKTIVFVTHSVPEAVLLADRAVVMTPRPGRIVEIIDILLPRPRSYEQESERNFHECARRIRQHIFGRQRAADRVGAA
jgi:NitT/TauT family transport system ATP-binding protein